MVSNLLLYICYAFTIFSGFLSLLFFLSVNSYRSLEHNTKGASDAVVSLAKWRILNRLHDRNETLYYRVSLFMLVIVQHKIFMIWCLKGCWSSKLTKLYIIWSLQVLIDNIKEFAPIVYTPTVGLVCQNYGGLYRRPRGMYFSAKDKGEMMSMIYNWPSHQVPVFIHFLKIVIFSHISWTRKTCWRRLCKMRWLTDWHVPP